MLWQVGQGMPLSYIYLVRYGLGRVWTKGGGVRGKGGKIKVF